MGKLGVEWEVLNSQMSLMILEIQKIISDLDKLRIRNAYELERS